MARNKYIIILVVSLFIGINLFFSCSEVDDSDHTPPTIEVLSPKKNAVIYILQSPDLYSSKFEARFTDDTALSSYTFKIQHEKDSLNSLTPNGDSAYFYHDFKQAVSIFDSTRITIAQTFDIDSEMSVTTPDKVTKSYPVWEGVYLLRASVVDKQGNITHADSIPIYIKYRPKKSK